MDISIVAGITFIICILSALGSTFYHIYFDVEVEEF